jgi:hypothetical protein
MIRRSGARASSSGAGYQGDYQTFDVSPEFPTTWTSPGEIDGVFGAVLCLEVLEHLSLEEGLRLRDRLLQWVAPGGWLILSTPNPACILSPFAADETHRHVYPLHDLLTWALAAGLTVEARRVKILPERLTVSMRMRLFTRRVICAWQASIGRRLALVLAKRAPGWRATDCRIVRIGLIAHDLTDASAAAFSATPPVWPVRSPRGIEITLFARNPCSTSSTILRPTARSGSAHARSFGSRSISPCARGVAGAGLARAGIAACPALSPCPTVLTRHDEIERLRPLDFASTSGGRGSAAACSDQISMRAATLIATVSQWSRDDIHRVWPSSASGSRLPRGH